MQSFLFTLAFRILALVSSGAAQCSDGYYRINDNCDPCKRGYYCDGEYLIACSDGYCCGKEGIERGFVINFKAPAGTYCESVTDALPASPCPADHYCPAGTQAPLYCMGAGIGSSTCACTPTSCAGRLECSPASVCVFCTAGYFCAANAAPAQCPSGRCVNQQAVMPLESTLTSNLAAATAHLGLKHRPPAPAVTFVPRRPVA